MSPSPVQGKRSFHFSDSNFAAIPLVDSTAAADMQCPEMASKTYNMPGLHEITRDMHTSGLSVVEVDVHSSPGGSTHHSAPSSTLVATVLGTTGSITIPTPRKANFFSGPYTFTVRSPQALVGMVPPNGPHPEVIQDVHMDSLDDHFASRQLNSSPKVQVDSLDGPMARDPSSGHPRIPIASMDRSDPVPCLATPGVFCRRVLQSSPQPEIASLDGMSPRVLIASTDTDGSDVMPRCMGTHHPPSQHVAFSPMSEDERPSSMTYDFTRHAKRCAARKFLTSFLGFRQLCHDSSRSDQPQHLFLFRRMSSPVKLLFRYPDVNFSNDLHVTSAPGGFPATWVPQTLFVVHQCTKPCSLALRSSLPSGCSPLQVQFWTSQV